jgi:hypothetical protein
VVKESFDAWSPQQACEDQSMRELMCLEESLLAFDRRGVDFSDRVVRAHVEGATARAALDMPPGQAAAMLREGSNGALGGAVIGYGSDNQGVEAMVNSGGSGSLQFNGVVKRIWRWLLARGARLEVQWMSGVHMQASGTDALSRQRWAQACDWTLFRKVALDLRLWVRQWGEPKMIFTREVVSGVAYGENSDERSVPIVFPGGNHIADYIGHLRQRRSRACVLVPRWHGPAMG